MKLKVCVVDDLLSMRKAFRRVFQNEKDVIVYDFGTAEETIAFLEKHYVDIVISDIFLQKGSGFDILRYVRSRPILSDLPVIFVTGEGTKDDIVYSIDIGVNDYVLKPFETQELLAKIKHTLDKFQNPSRKEKILRQAEALLIDGELDEAESMFLAVKSGETHMPPRAGIGLARVEIMRGDTAGSLKRLRGIIADSPMYFPAYMMIVDLFLSMNRKTEATEYLTKELEINGKQPGRRMILADLLLEAGDPEKALSQMRQAIVDSPKDERLLLKMAQLYATMSDHEKSLHYYLKTRRMFKRSRDALAGIVEVCISTGDLKKGVQLLTDQLNSNKGATEVLYYRSLLEEKLGHFEQSLADIETYLLATEEDLEAERLKAKVLGKLERYTEQAEVLISLSQKQSSPEAHGRAGLACLKGGLLKQAVSQYQKAISGDKNNLKFRYNLAFALEQLGEFEKALSMLETVLKFDPSHTEALNFVERIRTAKDAPDAASRNMQRAAG